MGDHNHQQQGRNNGANGLDLPPGFRFHPTDEEIITSYLRPRVLDQNFTTLAVGDADLNKSEPWELPLIANMGEKEWYFYCQNDRKYPTGNRANRATAAGYWKATGKDKEIYSDTSTGPILVGMKKTLVFYTGRAPKGVKTDWVMHEYRLPNHRVWAVCRVFHKCSGVKKTQEELIVASSEPPYDMPVGGDNNMDLRSVSFPMPPNVSLEQEDFTMDSSASFYSTDGAILAQPMLSPMIGRSIMGLNMNTNHFEEMMAMTQPMSFYQQAGIGTSSDGNFEFMTEPDSMAMSMLSNDVGVSPGQNNSTEILSMVTSEPVVASNAEMDSTLKY